MEYWLNLFTGKTWEEFRNAGTNVTGFRGHSRTVARAQKVSIGDCFLCYLVGISRWVGILEVTSEILESSTPIWTEETFPTRFQVLAKTLLDAETGVPMKSILDQLSFKDNWSGRVRSSLVRYPEKDAQIIVNALQEAQKNPVPIPVDKRKYDRPANLFKIKKSYGGVTKSTVVIIPSGDEDEVGEETSSRNNQFTHTEIQFRLVDLGKKLGYSVWAPKGDRGREWKQRRIGDIPLLDKIPTQFDKATNTVIQNIDVIWFEGNAIVAAFEVEHTTSIYSGLLRMSDLLTMQPNIDIKLYLVAPDERFEKFKREVPRPTFAAGNKPLHQVCKFLSYSKLDEYLNKTKEFLRYLKSEFIDEIAEEYSPEDYDL